MTVGPGVDTVSRRQAMPPRDVVIVKLGGSLITDKRRPATARPDVIVRLAEEVAAARDEMAEGLIIGHGSGSFGHVAASESGLGQGPYLSSDPAVSVDQDVSSAHDVSSARTHSSRKAHTARRQRGIAITQDQAAQLHRRLIGALLDAGLSPYGWAASSGLMARAGKPRKGHVRPLLHALGLGLLPVIYGDVVQDEAWGASICSTETLVSHLVGHLRRAGLRIKRLLWCGETDGIYDRDGLTIPCVERGNLAQVRRHIVAAQGVDVTGGMHLRLDTCRALARRGIDSWLLNGLTPGLLKTALLGHEVTGTRILANRSPSHHG